MNSEQLIRTIEISSLNVSVVDDSTLSVSVSDTPALQVSVTAAPSLQAVVESDNVRNVIVTTSEMIGTTINIGGGVSLETVIAMSIALG